MHIYFHSCKQFIFLELCTIQVYWTGIHLKIGLDLPGDRCTELEIDGHPSGNRCAVLEIVVHSGESIHLYRTQFQFSWNPFPILVDSICCTPVQTVHLFSSEVPLWKLGKCLSGNSFQSYISGDNLRGILVTDFANTGCLGYMVDLCLTLDQIYERSRINKFLFRTTLVASLKVMSEVTRR